MAGATSVFPGSLDSFIDGPYDPSIADAVNRMQANSAVFPPSTAVPNCVATSVDDCLISTTLTLTTGTVQATLMALVKGQVITNVNLNSGTASATQTHGWVAITTATSTTVLAVSADLTSTVTNSSAVQKIPLANAWTVPATGLYYVHVLFTASGTMPTFDAFPVTAGVRATQTPIIAGTGATGQTTPPAVGTGTLSVTLTASKGLAIWLN